MTTPPSCSLVSMNGPSVTWRLPSRVRSVVAVCEPSRPSHTIRTPASRAALSYSSQSTIAWRICSGVKLSNSASSPYTVRSTFMSYLRGLAAVTDAADHAEDERDAPDRQRQRANWPEHIARARLRTRLLSPHAPRAH